MDEQSIQTPQPDNVTIEHTATGLMLSYRWYSSRFIVMALFCLFWDGFLFYWYSAALSGNAPLPMLIFPLFHLVIGVSLTYYTLAGFINRTIITVSQGSLSIAHGPLVWFGNQILNSNEVSQLYVEEIVKRGKHGPRISYQLNAVSQEGKKIKLVSGFESADSARFIENNVEEWLGIHDRRVEGEV